MVGLVVVAVVAVAVCVYERGVGRAGSDSLNVEDSCSGKPTPTARRKPSIYLGSVDVVSPEPGLDLPLKEGSPYPAPLVAHGVARRKVILQTWR